MATGGHRIGRLRRDRAWALPLGLVAVVLAAVLYTLSAYFVSPLAVPAALCALTFVVVAFSRPAYGVAGAVAGTSVESIGLRVGGGSVSPSEFALLLVGVAWLCRALLRPETVVKPSERDAPILVFLATVAIGMVVAVDPATVLRVFLYWTLFYFVYLQVQTFTERELRLVIAALAIGVGILGAIGSVNYLRSGDTVVYAGGELTGARAEATLSDPNYYAALLLLGSLPGLALVVGRFRTYGGLAPFVAAGIAGLVFSLSRGAASGLVAGLAILLASRRFRKLAIALILLVAILTLANANPIVTSEQLDPVRTRLNTLESGSLEQTNRRPQLWAAASSIAASHPFFGVGLNQFQYQTNQRGLTERGSQLENAHSIPFSLAAETGFIGLAAFVAFFGQLLARGAHALRGRHHTTSPLALGISAALVGFALQGLTVVQIRTNVVMGTFLVLAGVLTAVSDRAAPPGTRPRP